MRPGLLLLTMHAAAVWALAGMSWLVQLAVYPSFAIVGPTGAWPAFHEAHSRAMGLVIALPWATQGVTLALLLLERPTPLVLVASALGLLTVVVTLAVSVPLHRRLQPYDDRHARRLQQSHWLRTAAWTGGGLCAAALLTR